MRIVNSESSYPTVVLNEISMDCATVSKEEFVSILMKEIISADNEYRNLVVPKLTEYYTKLAESRKERKLAEAKKYAENKWKTERKRSEYIAKAMEENFAINIKDFEKTLGYFDFDGNCGTVMGINGNCIISIRNLSEEMLSRCYDTIKSSIYFNKATGLQFTYTASKDTFRSAFRPEIKLILPAEVENDASINRDNLNKAVTEFYANTKYCGD